MGGDERERWLQVDDKLEILVLRQTWLSGGSQAGEHMLQPLSASLL